MSGLSTMKHANGCRVARQSGIAVWMCVGECPAMREFIESGQVDDQPWDQLDQEQRAVVNGAVAGVVEHALADRDRKEPR